MTRPVATFLLAAALSLAVSCDESDDLRDIEKGRDNPPAIDATPPDEGN